VKRSDIFLYHLTTILTHFSERELYVIVRPSVVCLSVTSVHPTAGDWNFRQCFYAIWYVGHLLT